MKKLIQNSKKKRKLFKNCEIKRVILKSFSNNFNLSKTLRWNSNLKMTNGIINANQLTKRCIITGRKNIFNKHYKISRLAFLKHARHGFISGLIKSTW